VPDDVSIERIQQRMALDRLREESAQSSAPAPAETGPAASGRRRRSPLEEARRRADQWYDDAVRLGHTLYKDANGNIADYAVMFIDTPSDGSCFFHAAAYDQFAPERSHARSAQLRDELVTELVERMNAQLIVYSEEYALGDLKECRNIIRHMGRMLFDDKTSASFIKMPIPPSPAEVDGWIKNREAKLRLKRTWAYAEMMHLTAHHIHHDIATVEFPWLWYRSDLADSLSEGDRKRLTTRFRPATYFPSSNPSQLMFMQFLRNHFQSIVFLSTDVNAPADRRIIRIVSAWERDEWIMRMARYWGAPQEDIEQLAEWRKEQRCRFRMPDGRICKQVLGHDSSIPHSHLRRKSVCTIPDGSDDGEGYD